LFEGESIEEFISRFRLICFRFPINEKPSTEDLLQGFLYLCSFPCIQKKDNNDEVKVSSSHETHVSEDIYLSEDFDSRSDFYKLTKDLEISYDISSSEERSVEVNARSLDCMEDLDSGNNINPSTTKKLLI
jgi:hypothetical protein